MKARLSLILLLAACKPAGRLYEQPQRFDTLVNGRIRATNIGPAKPFSRQKGDTIYYLFIHKNR